MQYVDLDCPICGFPYVVIEMTNDCRTLILYCEFCGEQSSYVRIRRFEDESENSEYEVRY